MRNIIAEVGEQRSVLLYKHSSSSDDNVVATAVCNRRNRPKSMCKVICL